MSTTVTQPRRDRAPRRRGRRTVAGERAELKRRTGAVRALLHSRRVIDGPAARRRG